ncbi:hypothetical protein Tco_1002548 [Tanacetum coccineum]|uniref:Uncharacterized protein n=1 Tax=Tanacetum coccineum TaxID=301880 RepID=A0ABQ5F6W0_9ASTR
MARYAIGRYEDVSALFDSRRYKRPTEQKKSKRGGKCSADGLYSAWICVVVQFFGIQKSCSGSRISKVLDVRLLVADWESAKTDEQIQRCVRSCVIDESSGLMDKREGERFGNCYRCVGYERVGIVVVNQRRDAVSPAYEKLYKGSVVALKPKCVWQAMAVKESSQLRNTTTTTRRC